MAYVYKHIRLDTNDVFYIGIGLRANHKRARTIVRRNKFWKNIVDKTNWKAEIIFDNISFEEAKIKEIELIKKFGRRDLGQGNLVNLTNGGDATCGYIVTEETKKVLSQKNLGKKLSKEHKDKIAYSNKGKKRTKEAIQKMSLAKIGTKQSIESINKRRLKLIGNKSNTGKKFTDEQKQKMKEAQIKRRQIEFENKRIVQGKVL